MAKKKCALAVLEGRWWPAYNIRVSGPMDLLSDILYSSPHGYHYEQFCDGSSLKKLVAHVGTVRSPSVLYIATHGETGGIYGSIDEELISTDTICELLGGVNAKCRGVFFSTCGFMTESNAKKLLGENNKGGPAPSFQWVAGYTREVGFVDGMALDLLFLKELLGADQSDDGARDSVKKAVQRLHRDAGGLVERLGFVVYRRDRRGAGKVSRIE